MRVFGPWPLPAFGKAELMALVLFEKVAEVLRVSLNRSPALNAINRSLLEELAQGLTSHAKDQTICSLTLSGKGGCFSAGADIRELSALDENGIRWFHELREKTFSLLEAFPAPTIAVIERYALGTGLELALCCDFRIAARDAKLGVPSAKLGLVESYEYFARLVRAVGPSWAKKLVFAGEPVDSETALRIGLVEEICDPEEIAGRVEDLLARIRGLSLTAIRETKKVIENCMRDPHLRSVADPAHPMVTSTRTRDFREATRAFLKKGTKD